MQEEELTGQIIKIFYKVYNALGFGFLENIYVMALERELLARGHRVGREVWVPYATRARSSESSDST